MFDFGEGWVEGVEVEGEDTDAECEEARDGRAEEGHFFGFLR